MGADSTEHRAGVSDEDFLEHYGVKGMKWGVRGGAGKAKKVAESEDSAGKTKVKAQVKSSGVKSVSNKDLQAAINRMQLEQNYKRLAINDKNPAARFAASLLTDIGKQQVSTLVREQVNTAANRRKGGGS